MSPINLWAAALSGRITHYPGVRIAEVRTNVTALAGPRRYRGRRFGCADYPAGNPVTYVLPDLTEQINSKPANTRYGRFRHAAELN